MESLLNRYFQGKLTPEERLDLLREIEKDKMLRQQFVEAKNAYSFSQLIAKPNDSEESRKSYNRFMLKRRNHHMFSKAIRATSIAAAVACIIIFTHYFTINHFRNSQDEQLLSLHVPAGQRIKFTLQDGTSVWLNARSTLYYPSSFSKENRKVRVEGEAFFDVVHDADRPFIVSCESVNMKVLGTAFNVLNYKETGIIRTSLLEGSLLIYFENDKAQQVILKPNEQITIENRKMKVEHIPNINYFLWTEGIYSFNNEPLNSILQKMELYFDKTIIVEDPTICEWEYTGKFRQTDGLDEILRIVSKIHKFKIQKDEENNRIILSK